MVNPLSKNSFLLISFILIFLWGCVKVPYTERKQLMLVSEQQEIEIGTTLFQKVKQQSPADPNPQQNKVLDEVGNRIAQAVNKPDYKWEFLLIQDDKTENAFALPGGKVAFYSGILPACVDENGIAVVMGHEVAHVLARHGAERMSHEELLAVGGTALSLALTGESPAAQEAILRAYGVGANVGVLLPYSRKQEAEADEIGLILMAKAGYNPQAAVEFWKRMQEQSKGQSPPQLLSTHPSDEARVKKIEAELPKAMDFYKQAIAEHPEWNKPPQPAK